MGELIVWTFFEFKQTTFLQPPMDVRHHFSMYCLFSGPIHSGPATLRKVFLGFYLYSQGLYVLFSSSEGSINFSHLFFPRVGSFIILFCDLTSFPGSLPTVFIFNTQNN